MQNLLAFLAKHYHWFVFIVLEVASFVLLFQYNSYQSSVWFSSANAVVGKVYEWTSQAETFFSLLSVDQKLVRRNQFLEVQVGLLSEKLFAVTKDSSVLEQSTEDALQGYRLIPAKVVSNLLGKRDNLITIDRGTVDGVKEDMGVVCGMGVVGIVYLASAHYSVVIPVLNSKSNISCMIKNRGYFGYLHWTGGSSDMAFVDDVPHHAHFKLYDQIVTSGYSSIFPPGILVGKIIHVYNSIDGLSYRLNVKLSTNFGRLHDVCVIDNANMQERIDVLRAAQDSIKANEN